MLDLRKYLLCTQGLIEILGSMGFFDETQVVSDLNKYEFLYLIYVKIIKFLVIWHHFHYVYVKEWSENPSKSMKNGRLTCQFYCFLNCGFLRTTIWMKTTVSNQFLFLLSSVESLLASIYLVLSYSALLRPFLTVFGRILGKKAKNCLITR
jgi:hypothetical protein